MTTRPWMPFYIADYLADTRHLTTEQHGAYCLLLFAMWNAGGSLPNNDKTLARICNALPRRWRVHIRPVVMNFFEPDGAEKITQHRLQGEIEKLDELAEKRAEAGRLGGRPKKANAFEPNQKVTAKQPVQRSLFGSKTEPSDDDKPLENNDQAKAKLSDSRASAFTTPTSTGSSNEEPPRPNGRVSTTPAPIEEAKQAWDDLADRCNMAKVVAFTPERRKKLKAILDHYGIDRWREALDRIEESDFCRGLVDHGRGWKADFDFAVRPSSFVKLLEGKYDNRANSTGPPAYASDERPDQRFMAEQAKRLGLKHGK